MNNYLAQELQIGINMSPGAPTVPPINGPLVGIKTLGDVVNKGIDFIMPFGAIILFFVLVWGGYDFLLSRGNPEKIKGAQAKLTTGIVGFILLVSSYFIVKLLAKIFGLDNGIL